MVRRGYAHRRGVMQWETGLTAGVLTVLGVESSCDDTAAGIVRLPQEGVPNVLANEVWAQHDQHAAYGGVVPEIAARSHVERVDVIVEKALAVAGLSFSEIDAIAATAGPGLVGGVMVGLTAGKAMAIAHNVPLVPVNHLEGHALSPRLTENVPFPYLLLLVSGGHSQLIEVADLGQYRRLGSTIDDAAGEAFDKTAKLLGLGQPGGPHLERAAARGRAERFALPRPLLKRPGADFSFSGLKTAVRLIAEENAPLSSEDIADIAASFQVATAKHLAARTARAMVAFEARHDARTLVVAGGVAANQTIKAALNDLAEERGWCLAAPAAHYCTDNGAMIALAGAERLCAGMDRPRAETLAFAPRARWPLAPPIAGQEHGGGKKGPKA